MPIPYEIAGILLDTKAFEITPDDPKLLASGRFSPVYIDNRGILSNHENWRTVIDGLHEAIQTNVGLQNVDGLVGAPTAGIPHAVLVGDRLKLPTYEIASFPDPRLEVTIPSRRKIVVIEDHVSSGDSAIEAIWRTRKLGGRVSWCFSITATDLEKARRNFRQAQVNFSALCTTPQILEVAKARGLHNRDYDLVLGWLANPQAWDRQYRARHGLPTAG